MIRVDNLTKSYDGRVVLDDISLSICDGEIVAVLGESGTGKSVLLKHMMGLIKPDKGDIKIDGESIIALSERELLGIRKRIGYLFQEGALYDFMDVFDNIAFPLKEHTNLSDKEIEDKVEHVLNLVDLGGEGKQLPSQLSGGMKKRVGLARAIVLDCKILFCDEPTSGLDPIRSNDITDLIKSVTFKMGCTTVITSHDMRNALKLADRSILIRDGRIVAAGTKEALEMSEDSFVQKFISI